jgi:hypothetical protein
MLGQHPQMYALPELHLFSVDTIAEWLRICSHESYDMDHGLVRLVAEVYFGEQNDETASRARGWIRRRAHFTTGFLLEVLAHKLSPRVLVEKSPSIVFRLEFMERALNMFPYARFVHVTCHPRIYCESVIGAIQALERSQPLSPSHWLRSLASYPYPSKDAALGSAVVDPEGAWYSLNMNVVEFLKSVSEDQKITVKGEDLIWESGNGLKQLTKWLGLATDSEGIAAMRHPEHSPFARIGPSSAPFGSDIFVFQGPRVSPDWLVPCSLADPLNWKENGQEFSLEVKEFAKQFGYV